MENPYLKYQNETEIVYDEYGNMTSRCSSTETTEIGCEYSKYEYDTNGKIISRKDSADYKVYYDYSKPFVYKYDKNDNLLYDGNEYIIDNSGNVVEIIPLYRYSGAKRKFDGEGRKIEEIITDYNRISKEVVQDLMIKRYKYDSRNLLIEIKEVLGEKIADIHKFKYE